MKPTFACRALWSAVLGLFLLSSTGLTVAGTMNASVSMPSQGSVVAVQLDGTAPVALHTIDLSQLESMADLPSAEAGETEGGLPPAVITIVGSAMGAAGLYLMDSYYWKTKKFNWSTFQRVGGCGAVVGAVWSLGGGFAGRSILSNALARIGAGTVATTCLR